MKKITILLLCGIMPIYAMSVRGGKLVPKKQVLPVRPVKYQTIKAPKSTVQELIKQKNELIKQNRMLSNEEIKTDNKKQPPQFVARQYLGSKWSWGALLAALGLGWLLSSEDEEKAKEEAEGVLKICRLSAVDPLDRFAQFIKRYGAGPLAEQLFEQMIQDDSILWNMNMRTYEKSPIPPSVIPFIKRHYYTLALSEDGSAVLAHLIHTNAQSKKELTVFAIRDMEKLCKEAKTDNFFIKLMVDNPEAIEGLVKKAEGHVEELVSTKVGEQLIDKNLIVHSMELAKERALILTDSSKEFNLPAFYTCMKMIKDDPSIEKMIKESYKRDDFHSLLRKIVYQKYCQHCIKEDLSQASVSLKSLVNNLDYLVTVNTMYEYIVPDKGLSHMVMEALDTENKYKNDYFVFYHGQASTLGFQQRLFSWLMTHNDDMILPLIYSFPKTKEEWMTEEKKLSASKGFIYHEEGELTPHSLYAVVDLFSNITLRLTVKNSAASQMPSISIEQVCKDAHKEKVYVLFKNELTALKEEYDKLTQRGQLLQFRVRKDKLEEFIFPSGEMSNDPVTADFSDMRSVIEAFQKNPEKIKYRGYSVGVMVGSALSQPNSGIKCSIINSVEPAEWAAYEKQEKALRNKIKQYLKTEMNPEQPIKPKSAFMDFFKRN